MKRRSSSNNSYTKNFMTKKTFLDTRLYLQSPTQKVAIDVSKYCLCKSSSVFTQYYQAHSKNVDLTIPVKEIWPFEQVIKMLHLEPDIDMTLMVLEVAIQFDIPEIIERSRLSVSDITHLYGFIADLKELGTGPITADLGGSRAIPIFQVKAREVTRLKFLRYDEIESNKKEYLSLVGASIKDIFENPEYETDSENSVFTHIMLWVRQDRKVRETQALILGLLSLINFSRIVSYYLITVVKAAIDEIINNTLKEQLTILYSKTLEMNLDQKTNDEHPSTFALKRRYIQEENLIDKFGMKVVYNRISQWKLGVSYASRPIFWNGYTFNFYIQIPENKVDDCTLAGYFICKCDATDTPINYIPLTMNIEVLLSNKSKKIFPNLPLDFNQRCKSLAIARRLNQSGETWKSIREGHSDVLIDDSITVNIYSNPLGITMYV